MPPKKWLKITALCFCWYVSSSMNNVVGKHLLNTYPHPMTLTFVQLASITLYSLPLHYLNKPKIKIKDSVFYRLVVPLSIGKFLASVASHVSIWKVDVSYAHTVKATMPLFTVLLTKLLYKERHNYSTYFSLIVIVTGVGIASITEVNFNFVGLSAALASTLAFALLNIFSKEVLRESGVHEFELLFLLARYSLLFYTPIWVFFDCNIPTTTKTSFLLILDGLLAFCQNIFAFSFLSIVTPLSYSIANASKRIFIIALAVIIFQNEVSLINLFGMMLAVGGVFYYNRVKRGEKKMLLPLNNNVL